MDRLNAIAHDHCRRNRQAFNESALARYSAQGLNKGNTLDQGGRMTFQVMALIMTCAGCFLGIRFIFGGGSVLKEWGIEATAGSLVVSRRIGAIYLGLALMFFLGRAAAPSELRSAVCLVMGGAIALLACLGLFEFRARRVSAGIFRSVVAEAVLAAGFVWVWWGGR